MIGPVSKIGTGLSGPELSIQQVGVPVWTCTFESFRITEELLVGDRA
jgi:hypothetical protein